MIQIYNSLEEIESFIDRQFMLFGGGWIYRLYNIYFCDVLKKGYLINHTGADTILVVGQEEECRIISAELDDGKKRIIYCTNRLKNEIDAIVMKALPEKYEREVLIERKKEIDEAKKNEFTREIEKKLKKGTALFDSIEIETVNRCNGRCEFCPVNIIDDVRDYQEMDETLFYSIIDQLADVHYKGRVALFSNNEPLLDKRIIRFAEYTSDRLPHAYKTIFTNGTLVNDNIFNSLINLLDLICFDVYYDDDPVKEMPGKLKNILTRIVSDKSIQRKIMVQYICRKAIRNNRGGISSNRHVAYEVQAPCMLPFFQMIVRPDGKTSLCCNDPYGRMTLSDLCKESILEAWNNKSYRSVRERMIRGRQNIPTCKGCDNFATLNTDARIIFSENDIDESWEKTKELLGERSVETSIW